MPRAYQEQIEGTFRRLKSETSDNASSFPVLARTRGATRRQPLARLEPVGWRDADLPESIALLAQWREAAASAFPAVFPVTLEGTQRWLIHQLLDTPDRLLFWVVADEGRKVGHVGLFRFDYEARHVEVDNIVRGLPYVLPGVMEASVRTLLDWTFDQLQVADIYLRVFADNARAIRLYERCGFRETRRTPLRCVEEGEVTRWVDVGGNDPGPASRHFVTMQLPRAAWTRQTAIEKAA